MSTTLATAAPAPEAATPQALPFWKALITGPGGLPDEVAFSYLYICQPVVTAAFIANGVLARHFALLDYCGAETALISLYQAVVAIRGAIGKGQ
jgi:hypothetical protein